MCLPAVASHRALHSLVVQADSDFLGAYKGIPLTRGSGPGQQSGASSGRTCDRTRGNHMHIACYTSCTGFTRLRTALEGEQAASASRVCDVAVNARRTHELPCTPNWQLQCMTTY